MTQRWVRAMAVCALTLPALVFSASGCASGGIPGSGDVGRAGDTGPRDTGPRMDIGPVDAPPVDAPPVDAPRADAPSACGVCTGLARCVGTVCTPYPACRADLTCPMASDICVNRRCIPRTDNPDGDPAPAGTDCDEDDPTRYPGATEICNNEDENCNGDPDDGDPAALCATDPVGGVCLSGTCGCPAGVADIDRSVPGCECTIAPVAGMGDTCATAIDLGALNDGASGSAGASATATGNLLPLGREVWYRVRATDSADTTCDNFHFRAQLTVNPDAAYEISVSRSGVCGDPIACDSPAAPTTDYSYATDFRAMMGTMLAGECPCALGDRAEDNFSNCSDNGSEFLIRVRRVAGAAASCSSYTLEVSNGLYST